MPGVQETLLDIARDHLSGAAEITSRAACLLVQLAERSEAASLAAFRQEVASVALALTRAHPCMASLFNLANRALWDVEEAASLSEARQAVYRTGAEWRSRQRDDLERIADAAQALLGAGATVLTHSRSSTVAAALKRAAAEGRRPEVICTESRPLLEGRALARELAEEGLSVRLVVDAAAFALLPSADLVLVGGDSLSALGLVNKIGTRGLAIAAAQEGVPFFACCSTAKFAPLREPLVPPADEQPPAEVWDAPPAGVRVVNRYFDLTPLRYLAGVVTEKGIMEAEASERFVTAAKVHPMLR